MRALRRRLDKPRDCVDMGGSGVGFGRVGDDAEVSECCCVDLWSLLAHSLPS